MFDFKILKNSEGRKLLLDEGYSFGEFIPSIPGLPVTPQVLAVYAALDFL